MAITLKAYERDDVVDAVNNLAFAINVWAHGKGFWNVPKGATPEDDEQILRLQKVTKNALVVTELSEQVEAIRKPNTASGVEGFTNEEEELADAIIRALDYAGEFRMNIGECIRRKMLVNEGRPYQHGGKKF